MTRAAAVITGLGRTGRLVTSAALILFFAFAALASSPGHRHQGARDGARRRHPDRRDPRAGTARAGAGQRVRPLELVAAGLDGPRAPGRAVTRSPLGRKGTTRARRRRPRRSAGRPGRRLTRPSLGSEAPAASSGMSGFVARSLSCWTAQVLPSGSLNPKNVPPSRSSKTEISLAATPLPSSSSRAAVASATHSWRPRNEPGAISFWRRKVPDDDRATGADRGQLRDVHVLGPRVVVEDEPDLVAVERDRAVEIGHRHDDDLQCPVHVTVSSGFGRGRLDEPAATIPGSGYAGGRALSGPALAGPRRRGARPARLRGAAAWSVGCRSR